MTEFAHGFAAMTPGDVADAKRRRADRSLEPYAAARGLEHLGASWPAGFAPALPRFREEQQQLMRGVLPGGRPGILLHAVLQTHFREGVRSNMPGSFYGVFVKPPKGALRRMMRPRASWLPVVGSLFDDGIDDFDAPFASHGAWAPITICATSIPESVAHVRGLQLRTRSRTRFVRTTDHSDVGGLRVMRAAGDGVGRLLAGPAGALLATLEGPYWEVRLDFGVLTVQRNGFVVEDDELDGLARRVCALADAVAQSCPPVGPAASLGEPLPPPSWRDDPAAAPHELRDGWGPKALQAAAERRLELEDARAWHERFPRLPVPGRAELAFRDGQERVLLCIDRPLADLRAMRPVLVVPAPPAPVPTPPGGVGVPGARVFVQDGAAIAWSLEHGGYVGDALDLVPRLRDALVAYAASSRAD